MIIRPQIRNKKMSVFQAGSPVNIIIILGNLNRFHFARLSALVHFWLVFVDQGLLSASFLQILLPWLTCESGVIENGVLFPMLQCVMWWLT